MKNIPLRLNDYQLKQLEELKAEFNQNTYNKTIIEVIDRLFIDHRILITAYDNLWDKFQSLYEINRSIIENHRNIAYYKELLSNSIEENEKMLSKVSKIKKIFFLRHK